MVLAGITRTVCIDSWVRAGPPILKGLRADIENASRDRASYTKQQQQHLQQQQLQQQHKHQQQLIQQQQPVAVLAMGLRGCSPPIFSI